MPTCFYAFGAEPLYLQRLAVLGVLTGGCSCLFGGRGCDCDDTRPDDTPVLCLVESRNKLKERKGKWKFKYVGRRLASATFCCIQVFVQSRTEDSLCGKSKLALKLK